MTFSISDIITAFYVLLFDLFEFLDWQPGMRWAIRRLSSKK
jgi:hypothetical protein